MQDENAYYLGSGIGLNFRLIKITSDFNVLKRKNILEDYDKAKKRLFLLDYEVKNFLKYLGNFTILEFSK